MTDSYVELAPRPALADLVRTVWIQQTGDRPYVQHHLPTGGGIDATENEKGLGDARRRLAQLGVDTA